MATEKKRRKKWHPFRFISGRKTKIAEGPLSGKALWELTLFSTGLFVFAALFIQLCITAFTAAALRVYSFSFQYRPFKILFSYWGGLNWTENRIYLVFISGPVIITISGLLLFLILKQSNRITWRWKLFLTWVSFMAVNFLPASVVAGALFFDGFGVAFHWMVEYMILRLIVAALIVALLILTSRIWQRAFLKTAYSTTFFTNADDQRSFLIATYLKPWFLGLLILIPFNYPFIGWFWPASALSLGFLGFSMLDYDHRYRGLRIVKTKQNSIAPGWVSLAFVLLIALLWMTGMYRVNF